MKILELKLKKDVLIVDAENGFNHFKIYDDEIGFIFENYKDNIPKKLTANDAFISAVESKDKGIDINKCLIFVKK